MRPTRPHEDDTHVHRAVVARLLPSVIEWANDKSCGDDPNEAQIERDLSHALSEDLNGYALAKRLDGLSGWNNIDARLVEILDKARELRDSITKAAVREWVRAHQVEPRHGVGTKVSHAGTPGTIMGIVANLALYEFLKDDPIGKSPFLFTRSVPFEEIDQA